MSISRCHCPSGCSFTPKIVSSASSWIWNYWAEECATATAEVRDQERKVDREGVDGGDVEFDDKA